jgi:hypothetical protein
MDDYNDYDDQDACICESMGFDDSVDDDDLEVCDGWADILGDD